MAEGSGWYPVLAKPIGPAYNLRCDYCYYFSERERLPGEGTIPDEPLEKFIQQYIGSQSAGVTEFSWQGGEPALLGVDFFEKVVELQQKHAQPGKGSRTASRRTGCSSTKGGAVSSGSTTS